MEKERKGYSELIYDTLTRAIICVIVFSLVCPFNLFSNSPTPKSDRKGFVPTPQSEQIDAHDAPTSQAKTTSGKSSKKMVSEALGFLPDSIPVSDSLTTPAEVVESAVTNTDGHLVVTPVDTVSVVSDRRLFVPADSVKPQLEWEPRAVEFNPDPTRAVWLSALFPGLGQIYNRRYWKLPIIVGGYLGLGYATNWNNTMLRDYTRAYNDIMDNDPSTKSYMDFFPSTTQEESLDKTWLTNTLKSRKDFYRRNRDLCIICMVGVYLVAMVDAYVDASLSHFDISPDLSVDFAPALIQDGRNRFPSVGLQWAINF